MNAPTNPNTNLPSRRGALVVISGPSGVGKSRIVEQVQQTYHAALSVSATTRPKRRGDVEGKNYFFVDQTQFNRMIAGDQLLEWAEVFGNRYGTPKQPVLEALKRGDLVICEIDVQGGVQIKKNFPQCLAMFILPPKPEALLNRLHGRAKESGEDEQTIQRRFAKANAEIEAARQCGVYDEFIVNDQLDSAQADAVTAVRRHLDEINA